MTAKKRRILVAIEHTDRMPVSLIHKAAYLAKHTGAHVELFHAIADLKSAAPSDRLTKSELQDWRAEVASFRLRRLERFARSRALEGIRVACTVLWDSSAYKAIVRQALATHAELVVAGTHRHTIGARLAAESVDWELVRECPVPLLIVKSRRSYQDCDVVAAVDPFHENDKPASLDVKLLQVGRRFARIFGSDLHIFHAYMPLVPVETLPMAPAAPLIAMPPEMEPLHQRQVQQAMERLARSAGIAKPHRHLQLGHVAPELDVLTRQLRAGLVIIGSVSRSGFRRLLIGNTAERVLDDLCCDVLVVKPAGFASRVMAAKPAISARQPARHSSAHA